MRGLIRIVTYDEKNVWAREVGGRSRLHAQYMGMHNIELKNIDSSNQLHDALRLRTSSPLNRQVLVFQRDC